MFHVVRLINISGNLHICDLILSQTFFYFLFFQMYSRGLKMKMVVSRNV